MNPKRFAFHNSSRNFNLDRSIINDILPPPKKFSFFEDITIVPSEIEQPSITPSSVNGIKRLDDQSQNLKHNLDELDRMAATFSENLINLETTTIECKLLAELSKVLSDSSLQQLDQIHKLHGSQSILQSTIYFFKSFFKK